MEGGRAGEARPQFPGAARIIGMSQEFVRHRTGILPEKMRSGRGWRYEFRKGAKALLVTKPSGPAPGRTPVQDRISTVVSAMRAGYPKLGAEKIGVMARVRAYGQEGPGNRRAPLLCKKKGKVYKTFCRSNPNDLWHIDLAEMCGFHHLSLMDDFSGKMMGARMLTDATTDSVLAAMRDAVSIYGNPDEILSDHGV